MKKRMQDSFGDIEHGNMPEDVVNELLLEDEEVVQAIEKEEEEIRKRTFQTLFKKLKTNKWLKAKIQEDGTISYAGFRLQSDGSVPEEFQPQHNEDIG